MLKNPDPESSSFTFRLFLDDYLLKTPPSHRKLQKLALTDLAPSTHRATSHSSKFYYGDLEEIDTFCCYDDEEPKDRNQKEETESFCLSKVQMRRDSCCFNDMLSIISLSAGTRQVGF